MKNYHVAFSFADEERDYVRNVAQYLRSLDVKVFYDEFHEVDLWGKDLYDQLTEIYSNQAEYMVMFISAAYKAKHWTNLERKSGQARALLQDNEYILPAVFDDAKDTPGLLPTVRYISLNSLSPEMFGDKIIEKLKLGGIFPAIQEKFNYSNYAKADIDFPMGSYPKTSTILKELKSQNFYTQNPAISKIYELDLDSLAADELFVLGRNVYQTACGGERTAKNMLQNLRSEMANFSQFAADHMVNGMFYEVYFNSKGEFRGRNLKYEHFFSLLNIQSVERFSPSVNFIRNALAPFRKFLALVPNSVPELLEVEVSCSGIEDATTLVINEIVVYGLNRLTFEQSCDDLSRHMIRLYNRKFTLAILEHSISEHWGVPKSQLQLKFNIDTQDENASYSFPNNGTIAYLSDSQD